MAADDPILVHMLRLSLALRELPPSQRLGLAEIACELVMENVRASLPVEREIAEAI